MQSVSCSASQGELHSTSSYILNSINAHTINTTSNLTETLSAIASQYAWPYGSTYINFTYKFLCLNNSISWYRYKCLIGS